MKVLNLYAGLGGNRKLWTGCEVTAVESDPKIAAIYKDLYPNDTVVVGDAHKYLLEHFMKFGFIWGSPPCPTHSRLNTMLVMVGNKHRYPDMRLYEEIIFLKHFAKCSWVIENVVPYYTPLVQAKEIDRHLFWSNFDITNASFAKLNVCGGDKNANVRELEAEYGFDLSKYKVENKLKLLRNCVHPETGLHIFNCAKGVIERKQQKQSQLF